MKVVQFLLSVSYIFLLLVMLFERCLNEAKFAIDKEKTIRDC